MTFEGLTWETKKVQVKSALFPWDGTYEGYQELIGFVPQEKLRFTEIETYPAQRYLEVYNDLEEQWLNVPKGHWLVKGLKDEFYPCEPGAMDMKYNVVEPTLTIEKLLEGVKALPDGYDDPRIDNVCRVVRDILGLVQKNGAVSLAQVEQIVADSTEHPDFWDENRVW